MELFFDTETSGLYKFKLPYSDPSQPWVVQFGAILSDKNFIYHELNLIVKANGRSIEPGAEQVHCISVEISNKVGLPEYTVCSMFMVLVEMADTLVCHNFDFDAKLMQALANRVEEDHDVIYEDWLKARLQGSGSYCTMKSSTDLCKLPGKYGYKWPKLQELHKYLFGEEFVDAHDALADVRATRRCYYEMVKE